MATTPQKSPSPSLTEFTVATENEESANHITIYSNSVQVAVSPWDIRCDFGQLGVGKRVTKTDATVLMSPVHAKAFAEVLINSLKKYEGLFGEIQNPMEKIKAAKHEAMLKPLKEAVEAEKVRVKKAP